MKRLSVIFLIFLSFAGVLFANDLEVYKITYEKELEAIVLGQGSKIIEAKKAYEKALASLLSKVKKAGDLDKTRAVMAEQDRFIKENNMPAELSSVKEIASIQKSYQRKESTLKSENTQKIMRLTAKYDKALDGLQKKLVQSDKLDDATIVQKERKAIYESEIYLAAKKDMQETVKAKETKPTPVKAKVPKKGKTIGTVRELVTKAIPTGHNVQVWAVLPEYIKCGEYTVEVQHAAPGDMGGFYITAWADTDGDEKPDKEIGRSKKLLGDQAGDWSKWSFSLKTQPEGLFAGMAWEDRSTVVYYKMGKPAPNGYVGLKEAALISRSFNGKPTHQVGGRFTNIKVHVPPNRFFWASK